MTYIKEYLGLLELRTVQKLIDIRHIQIILPSILRIQHLHKRQMQNIRQMLIRLHRLQILIIVINRLNHPLKSQWTEQTIELHVMNTITKHITYKEYQVESDDFIEPRLPLYGNGNKVLGLDLALADEEIHVVVFVELVLEFLVELVVHVEFDLLSEEGDSAENDADFVGGEFGVELEDHDFVLDNLLIIHNQKHPPSHHQRPQHRICNLLLILILNRQILLVLNKQLHNLIQLIKRLPPRIQLQIIQMLEQIPLIQVFELNDLLQVGKHEFQVENQCFLFEFNSWF